ncbi:MAG: alpha-ketoglutarate-dependent dioxygenase AlkB [Gammaproteobacteria bacterium]|nr:alpha-ketoglutarate-dependent dioxygenase AlkB [Gammaproteobacteria bacterium]
MELITHGSEPEVLKLPDADLRLWRLNEPALTGDRLLRELTDSITWRQEEVTLYGKRYPQPRLSAWYGDHGYRYSGISLEPQPWTKPLLRLKRSIESITGQQFNSVLLNLYRDHNDSIGMHSDDERELGSQPAIASLSLGEPRYFTLRHKTRKQLKPFKLELESGSLLLMRGQTQHYWRHGIRKQRRACGPRISLTFRKIVNE